MCHRSRQQQQCNGTCHLPPVAAATAQVLAFFTTVTYSAFLDSWLMMVLRIHYAKYLAKLSLLPWQMTQKLSLLAFWQKPEFDLWGGADTRRMRRGRAAPSLTRNCEAHYTTVPHHHHLVVHSWNSSLGLDCNGGNQSKLLLLLFWCCCCLQQRSSSSSR